MILLDQHDIKIASFDIHLLVVFMQDQLYLKLHSEDNELLIETWLLKFTTHELKDSFELVLQLCQIDRGTYDFDVYARWVLLR